MQGAIKVTIIGDANEPSKTCVLTPQEIQQIFKLAESIPNSWIDMDFDSFFDFMKKNRQKNKI